MVAFHLEAATVDVCGEIDLAAVDFAVAIVAVGIGAAVAAVALGAAGVVVVVRELEGGAGDITVVSIPVLAVVVDAPGEAGFTGVCREELGELAVGAGFAVGGEGA
jgi:hypothetical protein